MPPEEKDNKKRIETKEDIKEIERGIESGSIEMGKVQRYPAGGGLYLEMSATGGLHWRMKYRFNGKEKRLSFGALSIVSLSEARKKRDKANVQLSENIDPGEKKKNDRAEKMAPTFREVALEYVKKQREVWAASHTRTVEGRLNLDVYPAFGNTLITQITVQDMLAMLRKIEERRAFETASRVLGFCSLIFKYAISLGLITADPLTLPPPSMPLKS